MTVSGYASLLFYGNFGKRTGIANQESCHGRQGKAGVEREQLAKKAEIQNKCVSRKKPDEFSYLFRSQGADLPEQKNYW